MPPPLWVGLALLLFAPPEGAWVRLPSLPDREGFAGSYAGVSGGALVVAGGANFPGAKPWEGGTKIWHDSVFVLEPSGAAWSVAGRLPRPLAYGVSATHRDAVVCVGGGDAVRHSAEVFRLAWRDGRLAVEPLPPLPRPVAFGCGAIVGGTLYVAGGQDRPDATEARDETWAIDLDSPETAWRPVAPCPGGGRILAVAAACDGAFWVAGGAGLSAGPDGKAVRQPRRDIHRFDPARGWTRVADLPRPATAAPSPAPADAGGFFVLGGDDGSWAGRPPADHPGFPAEILRYRIDGDRWDVSGRVPASRATVPTARWGGRWVVPGGEVRAGGRSTEVWGWTPPESEEGRP